MLLELMDAEELGTQRMLVVFASARRAATVRGQLPANPPARRLKGYSKSFSRGTDQAIKLTLIRVHGQRIPLRQFRLKACNWNEAAFAEIVLTVSLPHSGQRSGVIDVQRPGGLSTTSRITRTATPARSAAAWGYAAGRQSADTPSYSNSA